MEEEKTKKKLLLLMMDRLASDVGVGVGVGVGGKKDLAPDSATLCLDATEATF